MTPMCAEERRPVWSSFSCPSVCLLSLSTFWQFEWAWARALCARGGLVSPGLGSMRSGRGWESLGSPRGLMGRAGVWGSALPWDVPSTCGLLCPPCKVHSTACVCRDSSKNRDWILNVAGTFVTMSKKAFLLGVFLFKKTTQQAAPNHTHALTTAKKTLPDHTASFRGLFKPNPLTASF